jgi:hypothetical protein
MAHLLEHLDLQGVEAFPRPDPAVPGGAGSRSTARPGSIGRITISPFPPVTTTSSGRCPGAPTRWSIPSSPGKDLESEMSVVRNEFEMGENEPASVMFKRLQSMLFDWHNYGNSTIGARSDIENVRIENLQAFLPEVLPAGQRRPDGGRQVRRAAGAATGSSAAFGKLPTAEHVHFAGALDTVEPTADGERQFVLQAQGRGAARDPGLSDAVEPARRRRRHRHGGGECWATRRTVASTGRWSSRAWRHAGFRVHDGHARARLRGLRRDGQQGRTRWSAVRERMIEVDRGRLLRARARRPPNSVARSSRQRTGLRAGAG